MSNLTSNKNPLSIRERVIVKLVFFLMVIIKPYEYSTDMEGFIEALNDIKREMVA